MKNISFIPKDVQEIISSHKIFEKYSELDVFCKKSILKKLFTRKNLCSSLFFQQKMYACRPVTSALNLVLYLDL